MKNKLLIIFLTLATFSHLYAENLLIEAKDISINKNKKTTIFKDSVKVETGDQVIKILLLKINKIMKLNQNMQNIIKLKMFLKLLE